MITRIILILLAFVAVVPNAAGQNPILGVLEDVPGVYAGESNVRSVRIVFQKNGRDWSAFRSDCPDQTCLKTITSEFPHIVTWNVGFDGRALGQVTGRTPNEFKFYSHVGLQEITSGASIPTIGKRSAEFGGFTEASVYRPLIANSQPYLTDPEAWKPSQLPPELIRLFRQQFRRKFPKLCRSSKDETKLEPFLYRDEDIEVVKTYASSKGWRVARLRLLDAIDCNDVEAGFQIDDPWFALDPQGSFHYLGGGMWLVDAGDYDNDGRSELVFSIDRENRGGYELFYDDFKKHVTFQFSYH
jgi:hypothetical protein